MWINDMVDRQLRDLYDAELRFLEAQQRLIGQAADENLKGVLQQNIDQTQQQIQNLEDVFRELGGQPERGASEAAQALVAEGQKVTQETESGPIRDALIATALTKVKHYLIASYRGLLVVTQKWADMVAHSLYHAVSTLQDNLRQEEQMLQTIEQYTPQLLQEATRRLDSKDQNT